MRPYVTYRTDSNQAAVVKTFRRLGFQVHCTHAAGEGFPDIVISKHGLNVVVEVKDGLQPPSAREFKPKQRLFFFTWQGMRAVVTCAAECVRIDEQIKAIAAKIKAAGIVLEVKGSNDPIYSPSLH